MKAEVETGREERGQEEGRGCWRGENRARGGEIKIEYNDPSVEGP